MTSNTLWVCAMVWLAVSVVAILTDAGAVYVAAAVCSGNVFAATAAVAAVAERQGRQGA